MVVVYYVNTYYLDAAIELLQAIIKDVDLHVIIEISPESSITNIIEVDYLSGYSNIEDPEKLLGAKKWEELSVYFKGVASIQFAVFRHKKSISFASFLTILSVGKLIHKIKPDLIHFDSITPRILGLFPYFLNKKTYVTVHDPLPHSGEGSWKIKLTEYLYFRIAKGLCFYSEFAKQQFNASYSKFTTKQYIIYFQPFTFLKKFNYPSKDSGNTILFFGRIVFYKGVDLLLNAIPKVISKFPNEIFVIAGKIDDEILDPNIINAYPSNIQVLLHHISTADLAKLIVSAKFVVCPYRDATQSGVLMTANALGKAVIATNVGAFPEYIVNDFNGLLSFPDSDSIADAIINALNQQKYVDLEKNVQSERCAQLLYKNNKVLMSAYSQL